MRAERSALLAVGAGGALGAAARYGLSVAFPDRGGFPWTTLAVNVAGCLAIGILVAALGVLSAPHRLARPFVGTGFLGGFTTFSTYADQTRALVQSGRWPLAAVYVLATVVAALAAVWVGMLVVRAATRRKP